MATEHWETNISSMRYKCATSNSSFPLMMQAAIFITSATRSTRLPNQPLQKNSEVIQA